MMLGMGNASMCAAGMPAAGTLSTYGAMILQPGMMMYHIHLDA